MKIDFRPLEYAHQYLNSTSEPLFTGILWNTIAFGFTAISGLLINILIQVFYDVSVLGLFNEIYAIYILFSQFAVLGVHLSILKSTSQDTNEPNKLNPSLSAATILSLCLSSIFALIIYLFKDIAGTIFNSTGISHGLLLVCPAIVLFSINKTFLAFINGLHRMKAYALFLTLRSSMLLISLLGLALSKVPGYGLSIIFTSSEAFICAGLLVYFIRYKIASIDLSKETVNWIKIHFNFGLHAAGGNILLDINSRIDILILGVFATEKIVGIYSFAAMLAEGFSQLPIVVRTNINPLITQTYFNKGLESLQTLISKIKRLSYLFLVPIGVLAIIIFPLFSLVIHGEEIWQSWILFSIIMVGVLGSIGYSPIQLIFNQIGYPLQQTKFIILYFTSNCLLNLMLIPLWGMYGSAIAVTLSNILQIIFIRKMALNTIKIII